MMQMEKIYSCECQTINHGHIGVVLKQISDLLHARDFSQFMIRKIYSVASECLENIYNHGYFDKKKNDNIAEFSIYTEGLSVYIQSKNCIKNDDLEIFQHLVENINAMQDSELKPYFQSTIKEKSMHILGGAGVGLIIMKRKSQLPLELHVEKINDKISYITLKIEIEIGTMKKFKKLPTKHTPLINFNISTNSFIVSGVSRPENADAFYQEIISWIDEKKEEISQLPHLLLHIDLDYFNSVSLKNLLRVFRHIITLNPEKTIVEWVYDKEDESSKEEGAELSEILKKEFIFIEK